MPTARVKWVDGLQFVGTDSGGHSVVLSGDDQQDVVRAAFAPQHREQHDRDDKKQRRAEAEQLAAVDQRRFLQRLYV